MKLKILLAFALLAAAVRRAGVDGGLKTLFGLD